MQQMKEPLEKLACRICDGIIAQVWRYNFQLFGLTGRPDQQFLTDTIKPTFQLHRLLDLLVSSHNLQPAKATVHVTHTKNLLV
jgi:hypothetical protein